MDTTARVGTAVAAGYLFGRFKKMRLALLVGTALASEDVRKSALGFVQHGTSGLASGGAGRLVGQAGSKLVDVGRGAAVSAASSRLERLSDRLAERTESLQGTAPRGGPDEMADEYDDEPDTAEDEDTDDEAEDDEYDETDDSAEDLGDDEEDDDSADDLDEYDEPDDTVTTRRRTRRARAQAPVAAGSR